MYCNYCGTELNDSAKFCKRCGAATGEKSERDDLNYAQSDKRTAGHRYFEVHSSNRPSKQLLYKGEKPHHRIGSRKYPIRWLYIGIGTAVLICSIAITIIIIKNKSHHSVEEREYIPTPSVERTISATDKQDSAPVSDPMTSVASQESYKIEFNALNPRYSIPMESRTFSNGVAWAQLDQSGGLSLGVINRNGELIYKLNESRFPDENILLTPFIDNLSAIYQREQTGRGCSTPGFLIIDCNGNEVYENSDNTTYMSGQADDGTFIIMKHESGFSDDRWYFHILNTLLELQDTNIYLENTSEYDENRIDEIGINKKWIKLDSGIYLCDYPHDTIHGDCILNLNNNSYYSTKQDLIIDDENNTGSLFFQNGEYKIPISSLQNISSRDEFEELVNDSNRFEHCEDKFDGIISGTFKLWHGGSYLRRSGGLAFFGNSVPIDYINASGETIFKFPEFGDGIMYKGVTDFDSGYAAISLVGKDGNPYVTIIDGEGNTQYEPVQTSGFGENTSSDDMRDCVICYSRYVFVYNNKENKLDIISPTGEHKALGENLQELGDTGFEHASKSLNSFYIALREGMFFFADFANNSAKYISTDGSKSFDTVTASYNSRGDLLFTDQNGNLTYSGASDFSSVTTLTDNKTNIAIIDENESNSYVETKDYRDISGMTEEGWSDIALRYYEKHSNHNYKPDIAEVMFDAPEPGKITIHLYDDMGTHSITADWYVVDAETGKGTDMFDNYLDLCEVLLSFLDCNLFHK